MAALGARFWSAAASCLLVVLLAARGEARITAACSACEAMSDALQRRLDAERPRNHLDMRHRLDAQGKRYGKVIDYKMSELRAYELLEELCDDMVNYSLGLVLPDADAEQRVWRHAKTKGEDKVFLEQAFRPPRRERTQRDRELHSFCAHILEENEEAIEQYIFKGQDDEDDGTALSHFLCTNLTDYCKQAEGVELITQANFIPAKPKSSAPPTAKPEQKGEEEEEQGDSKKEEL